MGLFSKRNVEPLAYPPVARTVHVEAGLADVAAHLGAYSQLWSKRADQHEVQVGEVGGWTAIRLPDSVHPWQLHNLAFWMLDCPGIGGDEAGAFAGVIAESAASPDHAAYRLVRDPEIGDALCGWDEQGAGWTVHVPGNDMVRGEGVPVPRSFIVPSGYDGWQSITVSLEDPGRGMNEHNESTAASRTSLANRPNFMY